MSKNRMINTRFWSDGFVVDKCNSLDRLLFLYLLTNDKTNIIGIYELSTRMAAFETGIDQKDVENMLKRLSPKVEYYDGWVYIRQFIEHQYSNPSIDAGIVRELAKVPQKVRDYITTLGVTSARLSRAFETLAHPATGSTQTVRESDISNLKSKSNLKSNANAIYVEPGKPVQPNTIKPKDLIAKLNHELKGADSVVSTPGRISKLKARLKTFTAKQLMVAATAIGSDPYLQGENDRNRRYGDIDFLLRNDEIVDKWLHSDQQPILTNTSEKRALTDEEMARVTKL